jgi:hypothetical protein
MTRFSRSILLLIGAAGLLAALVVLRPPEDTLVWRTLFDCGHVPVFGLLALVLLGLSLTHVSWPATRRIRHYLLAFAIAVLVALLVEIVQFAGPRDADIPDLLRGVAGAAGFLLVTAALDGRLWERGGLLAPSLRRLALLLAAVSLFLVATWPLIRIGNMYLERDAAFPDICSFESGWESYLYHAQYAKLSVEALPPPWNENDGHAARVRFYPHPASALVIQGLYPDWSGHDHLAFTVYSELDQPLNLVLKLEDTGHRFATTDEFEFGFNAKPGVNRFELPLSQLEAGAGGARLDTTRMCHLILRATDVEAPQAVYIDDFRLVP